MLAQVVIGGSVVSYAILIVGIAAIVALVMLGLRQMGVAIPPFIIQGLWIVLAAIIVIALIIFVARAAGIG